MKPPVMPLSPVAIAEFTVGDCSTSIANLPVVSLQKTKKKSKVWGPFCFKSSGCGKSVLDSRRFNEIYR